jgi:hypothetical protein
MANSGHRLHENFLPLAIEFGGENGDARRIAGGLRKRAHKSLPNHVVGQREERNRGRCPLCGANSGVSTCQDDIDLGFDQLRRMFLELLNAQSVTAPIDVEVLAPR